MILPGIRACVFDAYGTLFDLNSILRHVRGEMGEKADALLRIWRRRQLELSWLPLRPGVPADFWRITDESLDFALQAIAWEDDSRLRARLMEGWLTPEPFPEVVGALSRLRAGGVPTAILSNGTPRMVESAVLACEVKDNLDALLSAYSVGRFKPDPLVYNLAAAHFGLAPESVCFVSANPWDVSGAYAYGFRVVWINRDGVPPDKLPRGTRASVADLAGLPALLGV